MKDVLKLTKKDIEKAARNVIWPRRVSWTVMVGGKELPARSVLFEALEVNPNHQLNTYQMVNILSSLGFEIRFKGKPVKETRFQ